MSIPCVTLKYPQIMKMEINQLVKVASTITLDEIKGGAFEYVWDCLKNRFPNQFKPHGTYKDAIIMLNGVEITSDEQFREMLKSNACFEVTFKGPKH